MRVAVVDLGTNSTRLLVADVIDGQLQEIERRTNVTRLGEGVDKARRLTADAMERVYEVLPEYRREIDRSGVDRTVAVATSAVRDAENRAEFEDGVASRVGAEPRTIAGDEEARLTFLGATAERRGEGDPTLVIDIGGGSTEFVVGRPGSGPDFHVSTDQGSVRHTERHLHDDPPTDEQLDTLSEEVARGIREEVPDEVRARVATGIAVAGTPTSLAAIDQELDPYDPERVHGYPLGLGACERMLEMLASLPLARRREVPGLHPDRAPTIVAGTVILLEAMGAFGLDPVEASEADLLHGAALEAAARWG